MSEAKQAEREAKDREALIDLIGQHLTAMYCCTRVWSAWRVGTMGEDDFIPAEQTDFATDLADAILSSPTHERAQPAEQLERGMP